MDGFKNALYKYTGERLRRARMVKGMSQTDLAKAVGYGDSSTIYKIEKGRQKIPAIKLKEICAVLDVDSAYLTEGFDYTTNFYGNPVIIEDDTDRIRTELMNEATGLLLKASETQLNQIVSIMRVIVGGDKDDGNSNLER